MKNRMLCLTAVLISTITSTTLFANAQIQPAGSFDVIKARVQGFGDEGMKQTLIVMDDDDTLTMMQCTDQKKPEKCQYLGGPAWYSWQSELIETNSTSKYRVAQDDSHLLAIATLLLSINDMPYTDDIIPSVLSELPQKGSKLMVLTARGVTNVSATESQFQDLYMTDANKINFLSFIKRHALVGKKSRISSIAGPIQPRDCNAKRPFAYQQGVMYVAGQNKGEMLQCLLARTESKHIKNIIFVDDTLQNVEDVYASFEHSKKYNVYAYHYTKLEAHKNALTTLRGKQKENIYQEKANERWLKIKQTLASELQQPAALK